MLETVTTEARKKAKKAGMAKMPSHRLPHVKMVTIRISRALVTPDAMSATERLFFMSPYSMSSCPGTASPLKAGMLVLYLAFSGGGEETTTPQSINRQTDSRSIDMQPVPG